MPVPSNGSLMPDSYRPLEDYGVVGDGRTAALIARDGSVDWLCLPRFDSASVFAALLDAQRGGAWTLRPAIPFTSRAEYVPETNVLVTTYEDGESVVRLTDFMPPSAPSPVLLRKLEAVSGMTTFVCRFIPRPDYARRSPDLRATPTGVAGPGYSLALDAPISESQISPEDARYFIRLSPGRPAWLALTGGENPPDLRQAQHLLTTTIDFWRAKVRGLQYLGPYQADVIRSALALHLLIHAPTGAPLAAATTSLPQWVGGEGNWDYRYSWVRDSCYMLGALLGLGSMQETQRYLEWLTEVCPTGQPLAVMFDLDGRRVIPEFTLENLDGYQGSRPVRIGNGASTQHQLDIFGAFVELVWRYWRGGGEIEPTVWRLLTEQVGWVSGHWREPDSGIWEPRTAPEHHVYSKVMAWVALARGSEVARQQDGELARRWLAEAELIRADIEAKGWNEAQRGYSMYYGGPSLDAALLRIPALGFAEGHAPRAKATLTAIRRSMAEGPYVFRHLLPDGRRGPDASFVMLGFWLVQALALAGEHDEATQLFEELRQVQTPLGLYSEMYDPVAARLVGNFPQGFSHKGLIEAALALSESRETPILSRSG